MRHEHTVLQPTGLVCELLAHPERTKIRNPRPRFGWVVNDSERNAFQQGFRLLVASSREALARDHGDMWDSGEPAPGSGWTTNDRSIDVPYAGAPLEPNAGYYWKVRVWTDSGEPGPWSEVQTFHTGELTETHTTAAYKPAVSEVEPRLVVQLTPSHAFIDFGRAAFGTIRLTLRSDADRVVEVHLGEVLSGPYEIHRSPGGSRRYRMIRLTVDAGIRSYRIEIPPDERNTGPMAVHMPEDLFEVYPFRYCEIVGAPEPVSRDSIRQLTVHYPFDEDAAAFSSSSRVLNDVWELCRYTMKATSFCGYYVDGDRERIPYEADAYINQLGHYACDRELAMARRTHEYLITNPSWPTEWQLYSVLMAWNDYMHTGNAASIARYYDDLAAKSLIALAREDGLISAGTGLLTEEVEESLHFSGRSKELFTSGIRDIVDWPQGERDGHEMMPVNAVPNALHYRALRCMADIAAALGKTSDAADYSSCATRLAAAFTEKLIDPATGLVVDGEGSSHSSLHSNAFALAAGLVPERFRVRVIEHVRSRGMACSVYASQILLEALYAAGDCDYALSLLTSIGERSWAHMIYDIGTTITLEAWDDRFKPNQDWNHAWGAAPAGIIARGLMGIRPLEPGFRKMLIRPQPGSLSWAEIRTPTVRGPVIVRLNNEPGRSFHLEIDIPGNTEVRAVMPDLGDTDPTVIVDGRRVKGTVIPGGIAIGGLGSGEHSLDRCSMHAR